MRQCVEKAQKEFISKTIYETGQFGDMTTTNYTRSPASKRQKSKTEERPISQLFCDLFEKIRLWSSLVPIFDFHLLVS